MSDNDILKKSTDAEEPEEPQVRFGEHWIPAHQAWEKMETAHAVTNIIDNFNKRFPKLSNTTTRSVVPTARKRLDDFQMRNPTVKKPVDYSGVATELLEKMDPESVLDQLLSEFNQELDLIGLINLAGEKPYLKALKREAIEFQENRILPGQTAQIWSEMTRPSPGGGLWSQSKVEDLIHGDI